MAGISFDWFPEPIMIAQDFRKLDLDIRSFREPLKQSIQKVIIPSIDKNFQVGGRPTWEPLSQNTLDRKKTTTKLIETGLLRRRATQLNAWSINGVKGVAYFDKLSPDAWYGRKHQSGTKLIPQRPFAMIQDEDEEKVEEVYWDWISTRAARKGFVLTPL